MCMITMPGKNFNNDGSQKITLVDRRIFSLFFFCIFTSFFVALHRFWPLNDGNQLSGCRLLPRYDDYIPTLDEEEGSGGKEERRASTEERRAQAAKINQEERNP